MNRASEWRVLALACCMVQQVVVMTVAQENRPRVAIGNPGWADTTKSGEADGARSPALTGERRPLYRLHRSDVLEISFEFAPDFNQTASIQPDGFIPLKGLSPLYAEGHTLPEATEAVRSAYASVLRDPEVTIALREFDKPYFIATGEVTHPGKYELRGDTTITEALAIAGGLTNDAKHSQVVLFRKVTHELVESRLVDVKHMLSTRNLDEDLHLRPGDLLFVPQSVLSKVRRYLPASNLGAYWNPAKF